MRHYPEGWIMEEGHILGGLLGLCVGDALGVPVEFEPRELLRRKPVTGMRGYGVHNQPPGTWSDDSSLALCLAESLSRGFDPDDIGRTFVRWLTEGHWTPHGAAFDIGGTTQNALHRLMAGSEATRAGGRGWSDNGNGALMRTLPMAFHVHGRALEEAMDRVHKVSCITHGHPLSQMCCGVYVQVALGLIEGRAPRAAYDHARIVCSEFYDQEPFAEVRGCLERVLGGGLPELEESGIRSGGYVIETLEAALWCVLRSSDYPSAVLSAVNLGGDTDTTATVAGGLAGLHYGLDAIPRVWLEVLARRDDIERFARQWAARLGCTSC